MQISAGSPADGHIHRGDVILEIDQRPISSMFHTDALNLIQHAGGQITFVLQRFVRSTVPFVGSTRTHACDLEARTRLLIRRTLSSLNVHCQPCPGPTAMPIRRGRHRHILSVLWYDPCSRVIPPVIFPLCSLVLLPQSTFGKNTRAEASAEVSTRMHLSLLALLSLVVVSQTGSPIMPGPVPCVSTKTRGYMQPPSYHTERSDSSMTNPYAPMRYMNPAGSYNSNSNRNRTMSTASGYQNMQEVQPQSTWRNSMISEQPESYAPSLQKKVQINPNVQRQYYSPASPVTPSPPSNLIHRQFNSPMSLYSSDNVQDVMNHHISHVK